MADIILGPGSPARFYAMSVSTAPIGIPSTHWKSLDGRQITRAVGVVLAGSVRAGILGVMSPSDAAGLPVAVADVVTLPNAEAIHKVIFIQDSGAATIDWMLFAE